MGLSTAFILSIVAAVLLAIQTGLNITVFSRLLSGRSNKPSENSRFQEGTSVIIAARNEAANLAANLPHILEQQHERFEVIVVNDHSEDDTKWVVKELQQSYSHLHLLDLSAHIWNKPGKKLALTLGIKKASYEVILLTDADCRPASPHWISRMEEPFTHPETKFALGFAPYRGAAGALARFVQYETFQTAFYYLGLGLAGIPYMGVGRNLAYRRSFFFQHQGFGPHHYLAAGDDDLLVNRLATARNTAVVLAPESFTWTSPPTTFRLWLYQKQRHLRVGQYYQPLHKLLLGSLWMLQVLFYLSLTGALLLDPANPLGWALLGLKVTGFYSISLPVLRRFQMRPLAAWAFGLDLIYQLVYTPFVGLLARFQRNPGLWQ